MKYIKTIVLSLSLVILSALTFVGIANAQSFKTGDLITVAAGQTIDSMLFAGGNNINIAGNVNGDVYCAGQTITISGNIAGDVFCAGQTITISGKVDGDIRLAGQSVTISGTVGNSATIAAQDLLIESNGIINRDLLGGSQDVLINGIVSRDIVAGSNSLIINGLVGRDIKGNISTITLGTVGQVGGTVDYAGLSDPDVSSGGKIIGKVTRTELKQDKNTVSYSPMAFAAFGFVYLLITTIVLSVVLVALFPRTLQETATKATKTPIQTALIGAGAMIFAPVLIFLLLISFIGMPLAILAILVWIIIMIISGPFAGYLLGHLILKRSKNPFAIIILGSTILIVSCFIPFIGFVTMLLAYLFGTGMIVSKIVNLLPISITKK